MRRAASIPASIDVYLQPAVVGGGLGDIEEVLAVGRRLRRRGFALRLYRRGDRPLPPSVNGPWGWPSLRRLVRLVPRFSRALTVTPWWGVCARPESERTGRPGAWSVETADIERTYGADRVVHLSLEEFARTLTSRKQTRERWREGGIAVRTVARRSLQARTAPEIRSFHEAYRQWRAFDRSNVLHLFTGFRPSGAFAREFPEAIQSGPVWPEPVLRPSRRSNSRRWVWYASPSTSDRLAVLLADAFSSSEGGGPPLDVEVRGPRRFDLPDASGVRWRWVPPGPPVEWSRRFRSAAVRVVTGSRTLLEALVTGERFLYFNGVMNRGARTRRHRPEKIVSLLDAWRRHGVSPTLRRDLADFSRLRRVRPIVRKAVRDARWAAAFPPPVAAVDFPAELSDGGRVVDRWASDWAAFEGSSAEFVARQRTEARRRLSRL